MQREGHATGIEDSRVLREGASARVMAKTGHFSQLEGIQDEWEADCHVPLQRDARNAMGTRGPRSDTRDLWRRW